MKIPVVLCAVVLLVGCSRDPEAQAKSYVASGDEYSAAGKMDEAVIEYRRAVNAKPDLAEARYKLAKAYMATGQPAEAYEGFSRAADLQPSNLDAQLQAGGLLLAAGQYEPARRRAEQALAAHPDSAAAHILLGNALAGLKESGRAIKQMEQAIAVDPSYAPAWTALGAAKFVGGDRDAAGAAFRKAVQLAPGSAESRLALANFQWATGKQAEAEQTLKAALASDGKNASVHRALALFYIVSRRAPEAEPHFKALLNEPGGHLALADYYTGTNRPEDAAAVLREVAASPDDADSPGARLRLAAIDFAAGRKSEARTAVDEVLAEKPKYAEAHIAMARMLLLEGGNLADAEKHAREAIASDRGMPSAHYTLGLVALARRDTSAAAEAFRNVLELNPMAGAARLQLARLQLADGNAAGALADAERVAQQRPDDPQAAVLVSRSLRAQGDLPRAERELASRIARRPDDAALQVEMGELSLQRGQPAEARAAFEAALRASPTLHDARIGVITADMAQRNLTAADARLKQWGARESADPRMRVLAARVDLAAGRTAQAEQALRQLVTEDASQLEAYDLLGRLYLSQGQADRAVAEYRALSGKVHNPAGALTMIGLIREAQGNRTAAQAEYEQILAAHPRSGVAANNLAWIYAETGRVEDAIRLATVAQETLRGRPEADDTLGWAYYHKGLSGHAVAAFERAIARAPRNPLYHYHLGLAHAKGGSEPQAKRAFARALELKPDFPGADDARARMK